MITYEQLKDFVPMWLFPAKHIFREKLETGDIIKIVVLETRLAKLPPDRFLIMELGNA